MLPTGSEVLDSLLADTYPEKTLTLIFGPAASGKTTCCLLAGLQAVAAGQKAVVIDTERGFSIERLSKLASSVPELREKPLEEVLAGFLVFSPKDFREQHAAVTKAAALAEEGRVGLIAMDTVSAHYRRVVRRNPHAVNDMMGHQLDILRGVSKKFPLAVLLTSQVYSKMDGGVASVGGEMMVRRSKCVIELLKTDSLRRAVLRKHPTLGPNSIGRAFEIAERGLVPRQEGFTEE